MSRPRRMFLGAAMPPTGGKVAHHHVPPHHLVTHGVVVGMTGSGKTGLVTVAVEEALRARVPVLVIDVKGDLPNLLLAFPSFEAAALRALGRLAQAPPRRGEPRASLAARSSRASASAGLARLGHRRARARGVRAGTGVRVITPGLDRGRAAARAVVARAPLAALGRRPRGGARRRSARPSRSCCACSAATPTRPGAASTCCSRCWPSAACWPGQAAELGALLDDVLDAAHRRSRRADVERFLPKKERKSLAAALNTLLASPTFASWRQGATLDVGEWLTPKRRPHARRHRQRRPPRRRRARARARRAARGGARLGPQPARHPAPARPRRLRRGATASCRPTPQTRPPSAPSSP